eukprot:4437009-Amphidinium_carterae.1
MVATPLGLHASVLASSRCMLSATGSLPASLTCDVPSGRYPIRKKVWIVAMPADRAPESRASMPTVAKTKLCQNFERGPGQCKYGDKCHFAHGRDTIMRQRSGESSMTRRTFQKTYNS